MKTKTNIFFVLCLAALFFLGCGEKKATSLNSDTVKKALKAENVSLTGLTDQKRKQLFETVDYIDYIFYNLDFSMSQSDPMAVKTNLQYISMDRGPHGSKTCPKSMGRKFFHANGEIILEAEVILSPTCNYYLFMEGNTPIFCNNIIPTGVRFYRNLINQISGGQRK